MTTESIYQHPKYLELRKAGASVEDAILDTTDVIIDELRKDRAALIQALTPFVEAYRKTIDPGTADLYGEQPRHVTVTLGDCRHADMCLSRRT